jgi:4-methoxybenzoate monooxygenase (O-demethylating)
MTNITGSESQSPIRLDFDPFSDSSIRTPIETDSRIREAGPLVWLEHYRMWASAQYESVKQLAQDCENFSSARRPFDLPNFPLPHLLVAQDQPGHTGMRSIMNRIMSQRFLRGMSAEFKAGAAQIVSQLLQKREFNAATDLASQYILKVFGDAMGLPVEGRHHLVPFGAAALATFGPPNQIFQQAMQQGAIAAPWVEAHYRPDGLRPDGLGGRLNEAVQRGELTLEDASLMVRILLSAGADTTIASITNLLYALALHPDEWSKLRGKPSLVPSAYEEALRWFGPTRWFGRVAKRDVVFEGNAIREGQGLLLFAGGTCRDPRAWDEVERFDITRPTGKHLTFGMGIHYCLGNMLARIEVTALLEVLIETVARIELTGTPEPLMSNVLQGFAALPLRLVAAS